MISNKSYKIITWALLTLPMVIIAWKFSLGYLNSNVLIPETEYRVSLNFKLDSLNTGEEVFVKTFLPENNVHQSINQVSAMEGDFDFSTEPINDVGKKGIWEGSTDNSQLLHYSFRYKGKALQFRLGENLPFPSEIPDDIQSYLQPSEYIQSDYYLIKHWARDLTQNKPDLNSAVKSLFHFVKSMKSLKTSELTDAITALDNFAASCNGKSRLLVALCRAAGIPARVVGGIILESSEKRTSHLWAEIWMGNQWVAFDALNNHFAYLPANYMQLYTGDYFLISHTPKIKFDYFFSIIEEQYFSAKEARFFTLWNLLSQGNYPMNLLKVILLLPLCALVVGIFRNIIGLKTIGVFLPAIIAVSLDGIGLSYGLLAYLLVVSVVSCLHFPLEKWGILYTPKLIIMLTAVVVSLLLLSKLSLAFNLDALTGMIFFPIIVLTISAEKFARTIMEEGYPEAVKLQLQTILLVIACYLIFLPNFTVGYFLTFPETYLVIIGILLLLGRWIGLRLTEYIRFGAIS